jgi:hypothetical protein
VNPAPEVISRIEELGGNLTLDADGGIRYRVPKGSPEAQGLLAELRKHREWVMEVLRRREVNESEWPPASLEAERRFAQPHAKLFPFLGRKVRTPGGPGTLIQVFADRVTVVLDAEISRCSFFAPDQIEPLSREVSE